MMISSPWDSIHRARPPWMNLSPHRLIMTAERSRAHAMPPLRRLASMPTRNPRRMARSMECAEASVLVGMWAIIFAGRSSRWPTIIGVSNPLRSGSIRGGHPGRPGGETPKAPRGCRASRGGPGPEGRLPELFRDGPSNSPAAGRGRGVGVAHRRHLQSSAGRSASRGGRYGDSSGMTAPAGPIGDGRSPMTDPVIGRHSPSGRCVRPRSGPRLR
jgi:hypothetical protein